MRYGGRLDAIEKQMASNGSRLPKELQEPPELLEGLQFYYEAFNELSNDRAVGFGVGPIPSRSVRDFAEFHDMDEGDYEYLLYIIREMDKAWLDYVREEQSRKPGDK